MATEPILEVLRAEVKRTEEEFKRAKLIFQRAAAETPSGTDGHHGAMNTESLAHAQTLALNAFAAALRRFSDCLLQGSTSGEVRKSEPDRKPVSSELPNTKAPRKTA
jgi:hypothetical protein